VIDAAIMQKLLPKLHGSRNKLENILIELGKLCLNKKDDGNDKNKSPFDEKVMPDVKYLLSYQKLKQMHDRVLKDGFTSFAEA
jgi:5-methylcytosine-specific restriction protein B